jgi:hypothetical protein
VKGFIAYRQDTLLKIGVSSREFKQERMVRLGHTRGSYADAFEDAKLDKARSELDKQADQPIPEGMRVAEYYHFYFIMVLEL